MSKEVKLSINPYTPSTLPTEQALIDAGKAILESINSFKEGKTFKSMKGQTPYRVKTSSKPKQSGNEAGWHARYSEHTEFTFDQFWEGLGRNKATNEQQRVSPKSFIPEVDKVTLVKTISPTQSIWTMHYKFPPPISPRVFTVLQVTHLTGGENGIPREGCIISVPVDLSEDAELKAKEEKGARGRYTSVEQLKEDDSGVVKWTMATSSTPGGNIPRFIAEISIPGQIYKDVMHFLEWMRKKEEALKPTPTDQVTSPMPAETPVTPTVTGPDVPAPTTTETTPA
ncbi:hypothetical protein BU17DRAFT_65883 [Hysterangium stoloniferum]|nr:hypothetical protein BU17DRAFT_65883 [Hysterangium stoloniferum]